MVVLRALAGHFVERLAPTGMLLTAALLTGSGLFLLSFATGTWSAFAAATVFAWGVALFFPTMVGVVSEKMPKTGSLGIVLTAGVGLGDRKSTRLNSSHGYISYAVFCLKKKKHR